MRGNMRLDESRIVQLKEGDIKTKHMVARPHGKHKTYIAKPVN